jgi:4-nitrophenyl phosphatase
MLDNRAGQEARMNHEEILQGLEHLIIDMDGVLYRGNEAIAGAGELIAFLRQQGIGFMLATNNATRTPQQFVDKLAGMDVQVYPEEVLTSALATAGYLAGIAPQGAKVHVVGMDGLRTAIVEAGFCLVDDGADFVAVGMDFSICYEQLAHAALQIRAGARFIGSNPDLTFPSERGILPGAGSLLAFLEAASGVQPTIVGKPGTAMMEQALALMGADPASTAMLGDRLETDILGAQRAGIHTILVMSGVTDAPRLSTSEVQPDLVFDDVAHLHVVWRELAGG